MIKRINKIKNLGVFSNYPRNSELKDFDEKNIIYGWNYSGKTTISRLISYLDKETVIDDDYKNLEFEIEMTDSTKITNINRSESSVYVKVFNSDFIKNNLHFGSESEEHRITGIKFAVGDTGKILESIANLEKYIDKANIVISHISEPIRIFNSFDSKFTAEARSLSEILSLGRNFTKRNIYDYISSWIGKDLNDFIITDETNLQKIKTDATSQNTGTIINTTSIPHTSFEDLKGKVANVLNKQPKQTNDEELLSSDNDLYNWVKEGLGLYKKKGQNWKKCAFCGSVLHTERLQKLNVYYSNEAAKVKTEIENLRTEINTEIRKFENLDWSIKSENDLANSMKTSYIQKKQEYTSVFNEYKTLLIILQEKLDKKLNEALFLPMEIGELNNSADTKMADWIKSVKDVFDQSNGIISEFEKKQEESKEQYKKHYIASFLISEKYRESKQKKELSENRVSAIRSIVSQKEQEKKELRNRLDSVDKGKDELNKFIKIFLNREDLIIEVTEDKYFVLNRNGKIATHLSDGEKTAIAFSHFMVMLKSLKDEGKLKDYIVFIDDPISSLDANHIAQVYSLINSFFFEKGLDTSQPEKNCLCSQQLFISTHNFEFYSFINKATLLGKNKHCTQFLITKINENNSIIKNMPNSILKYNSEYVYLFSQIESFKNDGYPEEKAYIMPNVVRRFLEIYTLMKLPGDIGEIDNRIKTLLGKDKLFELKILHNFSHFTSFDRVTKHSELILRIKDVVDDVYTILQTDSSHLESLREGIGH